MAKISEYYRQDHTPTFTADSVPNQEVPEIKLTYHGPDIKRFPFAINSSSEAADIIREVYEPGEIELQEQFIVLYLNHANEVIDYYKHSKGGITATVTDVRLILAGTLRRASTGMILAHNHPSGTLEPSEADRRLTKKIKEAGDIMDIRVLDHLIITKGGYYSFADNSLMGLEGIRNTPPILRKPINQDLFVHAIREDLLHQVKHNKRSVEKLAYSFGITDQTEVKELTELAIVLNARGIATAKGDIKAKFDQIVSLYKTQVVLSHRTSMSIMLQQYSTPAPIAYLAGLFVGADDQNISIFEPSAGNGILTIAAKPEQVIVNEIDDFRRANLEKQGYKEVLKRDATNSFRRFDRHFDAVLTNPPFGRLDEAVKYDTFPIRVLDQLMALKALDTMNDQGKAAIIIGNHTRWDNKGRIEAGKNRIFFNYLYSRYNVKDVINIDGKLYSRQGTSFNVRLILINGRKTKPQGAAPLKDREHDKVVRSFEDLYERVMDAINIDRLSLKAKALKLKLALLDDELGAPYSPASESCVILDTQVPDSMEFEAHAAVNRIKQAVGGDMDEFVRERLDFDTKAELCKALSAEQIDAVGMAIYNIEARNQGMVVGDQTGIGKGRVAASMIRYSVLHGYKPIFLTEKANLFSDLYRDLLAIGAGELAPFIINSRESKTDIKDENGNIIHQALPPTAQKAVIQSKKIPGRYDFVIATYSQFNSPEKKPEKPAFLYAIAKNNLIVMDESHNSSGASNTGEFLQDVIAKTAGVTFLSATFAKRPDNMPVYAMKTAISDANMSKEELISAIKEGGVALQEVLAAQLVDEGQMIRRERSFEGVEVNYITITEKAQEHKAIADNITSLLREIISFQATHVDDLVDALDEIVKAEGKEVEIREGTSKAGVDNLPYFSKVFNVINQMLFSIKAETVAEKAIERLKEGKKPVIAFSSTMGSFIDNMENERGLPVDDGDIIKADFAEVLKRGFDGVMRYTVTDVDGDKDYKKFEVTDLSPKAHDNYLLLNKKIEQASTGITISPIDIILQKLKEAGYTVAEVTGRKYELQLNVKTGMGLVKTRKKINTNDAFRQFNNNEIDVLLINQTGSTGASAHAIPTDKVPKSEVKQRVMIVLQPELDINKEVQKRGRTNRTGQIFKPIYDYMVSAIPAEQRLMMMLQQKLKSLDANTTSNQKQSASILDVPDFLNKYGDQVVAEYLQENEDINKLLDDPLAGLKHWSQDTDTDQNKNTFGAAHKVSGRVAVLSTQMQRDFYNEVTARYNEYVEYLKQVGDYDLEVEALNLQTETVKTQTVKAGKGGDSLFGEDSILETVKANVLKKPFTANELDNLVQETLKGKDKDVLQNELIEKFEVFIEQKRHEEIQKLEEKYAELIAGIPQEKKLLKILEKEGDSAYLTAQSERKEELEKARLKAIDKETKRMANQKDYLGRVFNFFQVGKKIKYPVETFDQGVVSILAVSLGFIVDERKKNPYAPSAIRLRIAVAGSLKYVAIPTSNTVQVNAIMGASTGIVDRGMADTKREWETAIQAANVDRTIRHIITGNLLQAFSDFKGKLVSYTTINKEIKKGILMPEYWEPKEAIKDHVIVPIKKAELFIRALSTGAMISTNNSISIFRQPENFKIVVPGTKKQGGAVFLDEAILRLVDGNNFNKVSDKMVATLAIEKIGKLINLLQEKLSASVTLTSEQYQVILDEYEPEETRTLKILPPTREKVRRLTRPKNALKLKAKALKLKLELLKLAA